MSRYKNLLTGTALISLTNVMRIAVQFLTLPLLARLLDPEDYGVIAMAMPIVLFAMLFADSGLAGSLVRDKEADIAAWHSCFWLAAISGIALFLLLVAIAPLAAYWMAEPALAAVTAGLATVILLQSLTLIPGAMLQHRGMFGRIAMAEIAGMISGVTVAVTLALNGAGVWALVGQQVTMYAVRLFFNTVLSPYRPRFIFKWHAARGHVLFGWNLLATNVIGFANRAIESLVIGKIRGAADLGLYGMAFQFSRLPLMLISGPVQYVLYPLLAQYQSDGTKLKNQLLLSSRVLSIIVIAPVAMMGAASLPLFHLFLSEKWHISAELFWLITPAAAIQPVTAIVGTFVLAIGRADVQLRVVTVSTAVSIACILGSVWFGLMAMAVVYTLSSLILVVWTLHVTLPLLSCSLAEYIRAIGGQILLAIAAVLIYKFLTANSQLDDVYSLLLAVIISLATVSGSLFFNWRTIREDFFLLK